MKRQAKKMVSSAKVLDKRIQALNESLIIQREQQLSEEFIALMLGGKKNPRSNEISGDENWICNFH